MTCIRQVATLFDYREPQILEVLKNSYKIILDIIPHRGLKASSRNSKKNIT